MASRYYCHLFNSGPKKLSQSFSYYFKEPLYTARFLLPTEDQIGGVPLYGFLLCFCSPAIYKDIILSCRNRACKGKKPVENGESSHHIEPYESSSDSENEVLIDRIKKARVKARSDGKKCQNASKTSVTTRENENKQSNKFCARQELHQQGINSPSPSTSTEIQEDDFSIITFIKPTPQPDKKRSIFTRRQHRPPSTSFDHLEDFAVSDTEMQQNQSGLTNHHIKTISNHKKAETALVCKSGIVIKLEKSPLIKKKKQQRRRMVSLSSDSD